MAGQEQYATAPAPLDGASIGAAVTTIAFLAGILAADSFATDDATVVQVCKSVRLPGGDVAGGAGDLGEMAQALSWLVGGSKGDPPDIPNTQVLFTVEGVPHLASGKWPGVRCKGAVAIGSGAQGALTAMRLGKSAEEAVHAVIGIDPCTGGEVEVRLVELTDAKPKRKR